MNSEQIKNIRKQMGLSQESFAEVLGVSFATVNRWENGKAIPQKGRVALIRGLLEKKDSAQKKDVAQSMNVSAPSLNFEGDPEAIKLVVEATRLQNGHLFNKTYGLEISRVVPLPHQRIAVYEHLLPQNPLRYLLADDAGAGKTIMTGLYIREMVNRGRMRRVIIFCPAGLTWNWRRELHHFFDLEFRVLRSADFDERDPFSEPGGQFVIVSVDTAATPSIRSFLNSDTGPRFDLAVFDEAHKLSWADPRRADTKTNRYQLAEIVGRKATHLLLLTATPHMGKPFPYFALWRLLDPNVFSTLSALEAVPQEKRRRFFIRRLKEEMIDYDGKPIYKPRLCQTNSFPLTPSERAFYDASTEYLKWSYQQSASKDRNAAAMVVAVLQRRLASSTFAMLESLRRRRERITNEQASPMGEQMSLERLASRFDMSTADEDEPEVAGRESEEVFEEQALRLARPTDSVQRRKELEYLDHITGLGEAVLSQQQEAKFAKLKELVDLPEFQREKLLIFTEHRDTLRHLQSRFEALGYTGQIASIHGGMDVAEREEQRRFFMPPEFRRAQGLDDPDHPSARVMLATDAAGEGINLQFAWLMVNFDIPWNPARLEQRMGRLHRFGQPHDEVRIFNLVAENTREGDVLATLLRKLDEARRELCSDKVFDVVGQQLQDISMRELMREALFENSPYSGQRKLESLLATQQLRTRVEKERERASSFGDVAKRLGQLKSEIEVENFHRLLPAYISSFVTKVSPLLGISIEGDLNAAARLVVDADSSWLWRRLGSPNVQLPSFVSVRRDAAPEGVPADTVAFLRPGDPLFDGLCAETIERFGSDVGRGGLFCDPTTDKPYYVAIYACEIGETTLNDRSDGLSATPKFDRRLVGIRWDESGQFSTCAANHLLALLPAPPSLVWKAGTLLQNPFEQVMRAEGYARAEAEASILQQGRAALRAESLARLDDLQRGFDFYGSELAEERSELSRRVREGNVNAGKRLDQVKAQQTRLAEDKVSSLLYEQRRSELLDIVKFQRLAVALVIPDTSADAKDAYDKNIEAIAVRIATNYEVDHHRARVYDVSSPHLARGYDLESHRMNGDKIVIEVKGRAGRGAVHLTDNEWPTAANVRDKYWLYVVVDCATEPRLYRVQDPIRLAFKTRQSFTINLGDIVAAAQSD
ncbi:MAG: helicase-related protein [Candidatus Binatia bacterium]